MEHPPRDHSTRGAAFAHAVGWRPACGGTGASDGGESPGDRTHLPCVDTLRNQGHTAIEARLRDDDGATTLGHLLFGFRRAVSGYGNGAVEPPPGVSPNDLSGVSGDDVPLSTAPNHSLGRSV
ncbi:hypothetical protein B005_2995 [Nocardiopsis alba ATCC BAA-2165]|uniref:Uncharacterized protein n=1 Tax=Nocardiopsis alba (strain ATCC BAA-2165 / BE74) TaxID=1205910 RepID=J7L734_NOCAA|nr:hypothetical protein B005_2995 [Nocardiopsis alba ATCC BAA-2165]